jgi:hypothetical protein
VHEALDERVEQVRGGDVGERVADVDRPGVSVGGVRVGDADDGRRLDDGRVDVHRGASARERRADRVAGRALAGGAGSERRVLVATGVVSVPPGSVGLESAPVNEVPP